MPLHTCDVTIDCLAYGPAGVGRVEGKAIFVPGTVPGDEVEVAITAEKKTYALGRVLAIRQPSPQRRMPPCPYVPRCGGCPWQQVSYPEQLRAKEAVVREQLRRIGGISDPPLLPIIPSPQEWHYRHRVRLRVKEPRRLGFSPAQSHSLVEIESCLIADERLPAWLHDARDWVASLRTSVDEVEIVTGEPASGPDAQGAVLVGNARGGVHASDEGGCQRFLQTHSAVAGVMLLGPHWRRSWGQCQVSLDLGLEGLMLNVSPGTFTQVNPAGNRALIAALLQLSELRAEQDVIELYCGAGNLSLPIASRVRTLIGVEQDPVAVHDARANAAGAGLTNTQFLCASAHAGVEELLRSGARSDVVILDPPRAGAAEVIEGIVRLAARMIVYLSCDPATLARDLRQLQAHGYQVRQLQPLDLFPHTYHVETLAILTC
jgi:23S rRNA (uracil1939-C5)-methyltransferase